MVLTQHPPINKPVHIGAFSNVRFGSYKNSQTLQSKSNYQYPSSLPFTGHTERTANKNIIGGNSNNNGNNFENRSTIRVHRITPQLETKEGMRDVPLWLKSLRLHKYTYMFQKMDYDEMMALDEHKLENLNVTKGARRKIVQSIQKLCDRVSTLKKLEALMDDNVGDPVATILELRGIMNTPIRSYTSSVSSTQCCSQEKIDGIGLPSSEIDDENLPAHIIRILIKVVMVLLNSPDNRLLSLDDECFGWLEQIFDRILSHEAFTTKQKKFVALWKLRLCDVNALTSNNTTRKIDPRFSGYTNGANAYGSSAVLKTRNVQDSRRSSAPPTSNSKKKTTNSVSAYETAQMISQAAFQTALNSLLQAYSTCTPLSPQATAYYLGIASITSLLSSPEHLRQLQETIAKGAFTPLQFQHMNQQCLSTFFNLHPQAQQAQFTPNLGQSNFYNYPRPKEIHRKQLIDHIYNNGKSNTVPQSLPQQQLPPQAQQQSSPQQQQWQTYKSSPLLIDTSSSIVPHLAPIKSHTSSDIHLSSSSMSNKSSPNLNLSATGVYGQSQYNSDMTITYRDPNLMLAQCDKQSSHGTKPCHNQTCESGLQTNFLSSNSLVEPNKSCCKPFVSECCPSSMDQWKLFSPLSSVRTNSIIGIESMQNSSSVQRQKPSSARDLSSAQDTFLFGGVNANQYNSGYSSSTSERSSGAGTPPCLMVYNFEKEAASNNVDELCKSISGFNF